MKYCDKICKLEGEVKSILKQEEEEKQLRLSEMAIKKASNLIEHESEILSRPAQTWIKKDGGKRKVGQDIPLPLSKKAKREEIREKVRKKAETVSMSFEPINPRNYNGRRYLGLHIQKYSNENNPMVLKMHYGYIITKVEPLKREDDLELGIVYSEIVLS